MPGAYAHLGGQAIPECAAGVDTMEGADADSQRRMREFLQQAGLRFFCVIFFFGMIGGPATAGEEAAEGAQALPELVDAEGRPLLLLRGGWYMWNPYQFLQLRDEFRVEATLDELVGIDVDISNLVARTAGYAVDFQYRPWERHLRQLRSGEADIASGATWNQEPESGLVYSIPYRKEINVLYVRRGWLEKLQGESLAEVLQYFRDSGLKIGVIRSFVYVAPELNAFVNDPANSGMLVFAENDYENFRALVEGGVDGIFADRLAGASAAWRGGWEDEVALHPLRATGDIAFAFSEMSVSPETVRRFNHAIEQHRENGDLDRIVARYKLAVLLGPILGSRWFFVLDVVGTIAFAISGVLLAARGRFNFVGAFVLAALPAVGGGVIRDLLVGREPLGIFAFPLYLTLVLVTVIAGAVLLRLKQRITIPRWSQKWRPILQRWIPNFYQISDAVGLAAFTITGAAVAISAKAEPLWLWVPLLSAMTAAGGGILRDVVRQGGDIATLRSDFYAEIPVIWGLVLVGFLRLQGANLDPDSFFGGILFVLVGAFVTRIAVVFLRLPSPCFNPAGK